MYSLETFEHVGMTVRIVHDEDATDMDPHKSFGDPVGTWIDFSYRDHPISADQRYPYAEDYSSEEILYKLRDLDAYALVVPLRFSDYGSSGCQIETDCDEDRANGAYCFTSAELATEWRGDRKRATEYVTGHLDEWEDWANGNVWGIIVSDEDGDELDACWGFIGDPYPEDGYIRESARRMATDAAETAAREIVNRADAECRDIVTVTT